MLSIIPVTRLSIENDGYHLMIKAFVNGAPVNLLIDTGASRTVFDEAGIKNVLGTDIAGLANNNRMSTGIGTNELTSRILRLETFQLGDYTARKYQTVLIDMEHVHNSYDLLGLPRIHGILGGDLLDKLKARIDYGRKELVINYRQRKVSV